MHTLAEERLVSGALPFYWAVRKTAVLIPCISKSVSGGSFKPSIFRVVDRRFWVQSAQHPALEALRAGDEHQDRTPEWLILTESTETEGLDTQRTDLLDGQPSAGLVWAFLFAASSLAAGILHKPTTIGAHSLVQERRCHNNVGVPAPSGATVYAGRIWQE